MSLCLTAFSQAQITTITASHLKISGYPISTGQVLITPVNSQGSAIPFADATGSQNGPQSFACQIVSGAITGAISETGTVSGTCSVPDSSETTPANILYSFQVSDKSTGLATSGYAYTIQGVVGVSGTTWALDHYGPPASTTNVATLQATQGTSVPTSCTAPSVFTLLNGSGTFVGFYTCVGGTEVAVSGGSSAVANVFGRTGAITAQTGDYTVAQITGAAPLASPTFTGSPIVPGYETTTLAALLAPLNSPTFTGTPTVPGYETTSLAALLAPLASPTFTGTVTAPTFAGALSGNATTASNLLGTPALPNGVTGTTQTVGDNTTKLATDAFVLANAGTGGASSFSALTGTATPAQLPAATTSAQGAVELPSGASTNVLGSAAMTASTAYDAFGAATTAAAGAVTTAETFATAAVAGGIVAPTTGLLAQYRLIDCGTGAGATCPDTSGNSNNATLGTGSNFPSHTSWGMSFTPATPYNASGVPPQYINLPAADNAGNLFIVNLQTNPGVQDSGATDGNGQWPIYATIMGTQGTASTDVAILSGLGTTIAGEGSVSPSINIGNGQKTTTAKSYGGVITVATYIGNPNRVWVNGIEQTYPLQGTATATPTNFWSIGGYPGNTSFAAQSAFSGTVGMALVYNTSQTGTALGALVQQATAYVNGVVNSRPGLPVLSGSTAVKSSIVWVADSIGAGLVAGGTTIQQYLALNNTYTIVNNSVSSVTARTIAALFQTRNASYISSGGATPSKCVIALGTNDVSNINQTPAQTWANIILIGQQCHADGAQSVLVTMMDRGGEDANKDALNTLERQHWKSSGAFDAIADIGEIPQLGADGVSGNATYFVTGAIHPTSAGQQLYAGGISNSINYLDGYSSGNPNVVSTGTTYTMTTADSYLQLTGSQTGVTLPPCTGMTGATYRIFSTAGVTVSNSTDAASGIVGSTTIPANTTYMYMVNLYGGSTAGGCNYIITQ